MIKKGSSYLMIFLLLLLFSGGYSSQEDISYEGAEYRSGELILFLEQGAREMISLSLQGEIANIGISAIDELNETYRVYKVERLVRGKISESGKQYGMDLLYHLFMPENADILKAVEIYKKSPLVYDAFPNIKYQLLDTPNDPQYTNQWALPNIHAPEGWDIQKGDSTVILGVIDTAIDWDHPDLEDNLWINSVEDINGNGRFDNFPEGSGGDLNGIDDDVNGFVDDVIGWDFASWNNNPTPPVPGFDHGTWCNGIANMVTDNSLGGAGVAWNARMMAFRTNLFTNQLINSINYSTNMGAHVLSMSWGGPFFNSGVNNALQNAHANNLVLCAASGNDNSSSVFYPAGYANVIAVSATDQSDSKAGFSNYGTWVDVCAPGVSILGANNGGGYVSTNGTSASCPVAAGAVALLISQNPLWTNVQIENLLFNTCDNIDSLNPGYAGLLGYGRINLCRALKSTVFSNITFADFQIDDSAGDNDGRAEFGETVNLIVTLQNETGWQDASGVTATLSTTESRINITNATASFTNIPNGSTGDNISDPFVFTMTDSFVHNVTFDLAINATPAISSCDSVQPGFMAMIGHPDLLLVDDDGGSVYEDWYREPLNNLDIPFDEWNVNIQGIPPGAGVYGLRNHSVVVWFTGDETTTITSAEQESLMTFMDNGGHLFITGQNIGEEIGGTPFYSNYLKASFDLANADNNVLFGVSGDEVTDGIDIVIQGSNGAGNASSEDKISPLAGADSIFTYMTALGNGGLKYDSGVYRMVYFGFPFEAIHGAGSFASRDTVMYRVLFWLNPTTVGVEEESSEFGLRVAEFRLNQNIPNPFHKLTAISYQLKAASHTTLKIYDLTGRLVQTLVNESQEAGVYQLPITSHQLPGSGVYFYRLTAGDITATRKLILLK
jgi:subtilisin family serine protease